MATKKKKKVRSSAKSSAGSKARTKRATAAKKATPTKRPKLASKAKARGPAVAKAKPKARATPKAKAKAKPTAHAKAKTRATPKAAAKAKAATPRKTKPAATKPAAARTRRDATGHLDEAYASELRAKSRASQEPRDEDHAFVDQPASGDDLANELGEEAVATMTSGEDQSERLYDLATIEEEGGPFVSTTGREEFASGTDASNPKDALREPFPKT